MDLAQQQEHIVQLQEGSFLIDTNLKEQDLNKILMERLQNLLEAKPLTKALVLSGSNFAARKLEALLYQANFFRRLDCRDRYEVRSLTSFCWNFLYIYFEEAELPSDVGLCESEQDRLTILRDAIISDEQLAEHFAQSPNKETLLKKLVQAISLCKNNELDPSTYRDIELFPQIYQKYQQQLADRHAIDKDDVIALYIKILENNSRLRYIYNGAYEFVIVLEAQYLTQLQYKLLKTLCLGETKNLMMIGDLSCPIFGINDGNSKFMAQDFVADFNPVIYHLTKNEKHSLFKTQNNDNSQPSSFNAVNFA